MNVARFKLPAAYRNIQLPAVNGLLPLVHNHKRSAQNGRVQLLFSGSIRADGVDMRTGRDPLVFYKRFSCRRERDKNIGILSTFTNAGTSFKYRIF